MTAARPVVLLVDDVETNLELLEAVLGKLECDFIRADCGEAALERVRERDLAVILLDIQMPGIDGYEVARRVRADPATSQVPIVFLTAMPETEQNVLRGYGSGAIDYMPKPFNSKVLRSKVGIFLELYRGRRELAEAYEQLKGTQAALVQNEKMASLGLMVAGIAHEINNPLSFVSNNVAVLERDLGDLRDLVTLYRRGDDTLRQHERALHAELAATAERLDVDYTIDNLGRLFERTREGLRRIQQIVLDLRNFARLDEAEVQDADLNAGIESTVNIVHGRAKAADVELELELGPLPPIPCHPAKINQVILNLLGNAIDASPAGAKVLVRSHTEDHHVVVEVIDHGTGISPSVLGRIFDPFFTTKPPGLGTGLGLSLSYGIVRDHGGTIEVSSTLGQGARFTVRLPRTSTPDDEDITGRRAGV